MSKFQTVNRVPYFFACDVGVVTPLHPDWKIEKRRRTVIIEVGGHYGNGYSANFFIAKRVRKSNLYRIVAEW